jgi:pyruvate/2-oxoglutarate/acetoin dehydrogenase E1 component
MRVLEQLNQSLHAVMAERSDVLFIGEDVLDPYGGAFKVSKGLSTAFPDQVITTPISEASIVGLGTGLALQGYRPVVEIMFGDFITLIADQLVNQAAKMTWMYNRELAVPIVVRTPMGGRRGVRADP